MRFYVETLGCPKNTVDSEGIQRDLQEQGLVPVSRPEKADVLIVNTCGFIDLAREESLQALRQLAKRKRPHQRLVAAGCMAERFASEIQARVPQVDLLVGPNHLAEIATLVLAGTAPIRTTPPISPHPTRRSSAYLKIADGCSASCAFCLIPKLKGPYRSKPRDRVLAEARALAAQGVKEISLVAQDTTAYGFDWGERDALPGLLQNLCGSIPEITWWRIMYAYPSHVSDRLIKVMAENPHICHYLDLPLQHAHPAMLQRMRRPADLAITKDRLNALRSAMPDIAIRTSLIVGFPGETEEEFQFLLEFMAEMTFDRAGVFTYSREEGTPAAEMTKQVPARIKKERFARAMEAQQKISMCRQEDFLGQCLDVLIEGEAQTITPIGQRGRQSSPRPTRLLVGRSFRDAPEVDGLVFCSGQGAAGDMVRVRLTEALPYDLVGEIMEQNLAVENEKRTVRR